MILDRGQDPGLIEHDVHVTVVPQSRKDLAGDVERGPSMMVFLDRLGKREREFAGLLCGDHDRRRTIAAGQPYPELSVASAALGQSPRRRAVSVRAVGARAISCARAT